MSQVLVAKHWKNSPKLLELNAFSNVYFDKKVCSVVSFLGVITSSVTADILSAMVVRQVSSLKNKI